MEWTKDISLSFSKVQKIEMDTTINHQTIATAIASINRGGHYRTPASINQINRGRQTNRQLTEACHSRRLENPPWLIQNACHMVKIIVVVTIIFHCLLTEYLGKYKRIHHFVFNTPNDHSITFLQTQIRIIEHVLRFHRITTVLPFENMVPLSLF